MFVVCLAADKGRKCKLVMTVTPDDVNGDNGVRRAVRAIHLS